MTKSKKVRNDRVKSMGGEEPCLAAEVDVADSGYGFAQEG